MVRPLRADWEIEIEKHTRHIASNKKVLEGFDEGKLFLILAKKLHPEENQLVDTEKYMKARDNEMNARIEYSKTMLMLIKNLIGVQNKEFSKIMYTRLCSASTDIIEALEEEMECDMNDTNHLNEQQYIELCDMYKKEMELWDKISNSMGSVDWFGE